MLVSDGKIPLGEWLPDRPVYQNPGLLEAKNCIPIDDNYRDFASIQTTGDALAASAVPVGAFAAIDNNGDPDTYVGTLTTLVEKVGTTWADRTPAPYTTASNGRWHFSQFDTYVIATNYDDVPQRKVVGSASNFQDLATTGTAPNARVVGIIGRFAFLGDIDDGTQYPYAVQWSAIDDVTNWPTPASISARTVQSGREYLDASYGAVTAIAGGKFYGLVFQKRAITRFTYIGGDVVFQVDTFERERGCWSADSMVQIGNVCRFLAADGWYATDGQTVIPIGDGKIDRTFFLAFNQENIRLLTHTIEWQSKCIFWSYPTASAAANTCDRVLIYNFARDRWSWAENTTQILIRSFTQSTSLEELDAIYGDLDSIPVSLDSVLFQGGIPTAVGFAGGKLGNFSGSKLTARFETGELDGNAFGRVFIRGLRPLVTGSPTSIQCSLSVRDTQDGAGPSFSTAVSRTTRTGVCDFRTQGRFISTRMDVAGGFDRAIAIEFDAEQGDQV